MSRTAFFPRILVCGLLSWPLLGAQTEFIRGNFFPADLEFRELQEVLSDSKLDDADGLEALPDGPVLYEAGFKSYAERVYGLEGGGTLSIEVLAFEDARGAYSLLTLLRSASIRRGPPGDFLTTSPDSLMFVQGNQWVRIRTDGPAYLPQRVATSVSNRIGIPQPRAPLLLSHFPAKGYDPDSVRYVMGPLAQNAYAEPIGGVQVEFPVLVELAQARYFLEEESGILTLVSFPTMQMAQDYFESGALSESGINTDKSRIYARRAGPVLAVLEGDFQIARADGILESLEFTYSIQWIYDKNNRTGRTIWGVPVGILGTVVRSLLFVALLGATSILAGAGIAAFRMGLETYGPERFRNRSKRNELIRLKINEN